MIELEDWLTHLEARYPTRPVKLGLSRVEAVAQRLGLTSLDPVVITVAGTNGKGSTVAALEAVYLAAGYQVAAYTSPHLLKFNERIRLNGQMVSNEILLEAFAVVHEAEAGLQALTYFEFVTLAALWIFKEASFFPSPAPRERVQKALAHPLPSPLPEGEGGVEGLHLVILEVGLGGRLDATNMIDADLSILTTIDFDHQAYLGHTREAIGYEKAGILRPQQRCIFASQNPPNSVLEVAKQLDVQLWVLGRDYALIKRPQQHLHPEALSAAQLATQLLQNDLPIKPEALLALETVTLTGRLQRLPGEVEVLVDVAHNEQSARRLAAFLQEKHPKKRVLAVFSALSDKAIPQMLSALSNSVQAWHVACLEDKRAAPLAQLQGAFSSYPKKRVLWYNSVLSAFLGARAQAQADRDLILVFGSFLTVAAVLEEYKKDEISTR